MIILKISTNETQAYYQTNNIKSTRMVPFNDYQKVNAALLVALRKEYDLH